MGDVSYFSGQAPPIAGQLGGDALLGLRSDTGTDFGLVNGNVTVGQFDSHGALRMTPQGGNPTYGVGTPSFTAATTPTDIWSLPGNATTTVEVIQLTVTTFHATTGASGLVQLIRRNATNQAGGTRTTTTPLPLDTRNTTALSIPGYYTVVPTTLGTSIGIISSAIVTQGTTGAGTINFNFEPRAGGQPIRLSGTTDLLCINVANALGIAGNNYAVSVVTREVPSSA